MRNRLVLWLFALFLAAPCACADGLRPIETAPRDGTRIVIYDKYLPCGIVVSWKFHPLARLVAGGSLTVQGDYGFVADDGGLLVFGGDISPLEWAVKPIDRTCDGVPQS